MANENSENSHKSHKTFNVMFLIIPFVIKKYYNKPVMHLTNYNNKGIFYYYTCKLNIFIKYYLLKSYLKKNLPFFIFPKVFGRFKNGQGFYVHFSFGEILSGI